ncbi:DUF881 domain-containing protein [Actinoplanes regularis]|uniref:Uncharacterized conserved protein YlxW, UPF0749 family n=1 Tax=Actinoplanes regularis TaxID=52697 RepID=A0A238Y4P7_9ACTN|nr:DUF881 domain-containing protein [Actinoplanes regularis]GIE86214.1 membrane protein [Actinoplanes regularis]GLW27912.1 membrane protein [Actinoplanes regularis]SNR65761.1 Uncharacterized conserved protein YlxW, UPF0749 family [Actinoplanes regularis]
MTTPQSPGQHAGRAVGGEAATPDPDGTAAGRRTYGPDFLTALFQNPLDPGYADAAARRAAGHGRTGVRKRLTGGFAALTLGAIGFLLVIGYQTTVADEPGRTQARDALIKQVESRRAQTEDLQARADLLADQVADLRERQLGGAAVAGIDNLEAATGQAPVRGSGARIALADGPTSVDAVTGERSTVAQVKDTDLQLAANALWAAGAEAIAINGQRLTATSTIRQAGEAILVDTRPVGMPYEVVALGPPKLADDFRNGYAGKFFQTLAQQYGMTFEATKIRNVTLDAAPELKLRSASQSTPSPAPPGVPFVAGSGAPSGSPSPAGSPSEGGR